MTFFSDRDRALVEALVYNPNAEPSFEILKACLIWRDDESPANITPHGYDRLCDLWIARSYLHRGLPIGQGELVAGHFAGAWAQAQREAIRWPGFKRLTLSEVDRAFYERELAELARATEY